MPLALLLLLANVTAVTAAPLELRNTWAEDALRVLKEKGLMLDPSFKGDRAMTRWEVAMVLARLLSLQEQQQQQFLSKAEKDTLERLVLELKPELEGLGLRLDQLESQVEQLEARIVDKERVRFKGRLVNVFVGAAFFNTGQNASGGAPNSIGFEKGVGSTLTSNFVPHGVQGIVPSFDLIKGRPWLDGVGMTSTLYLDVEFEPDNDWYFLTRFYAFNSQGNSALNSVWGGPAPYLSNSFTGQPSANSQSISRQPFTNMGLDRLQAFHAPTGLTITLGTFRPKYISSQIFSGQVNPASFDPRFLESYGFQVTGEQKLSSKAKLGWEVFGTYLPDGNPPNPAVGLSPYRNEAYGGALEMNWGRWRTNLGYLHAASQASDGQVLGVGLSNLVNGGTGQVNINWVNPPGFFSGQLSKIGSGGIGSTSDQRPVPGLAGSDAAGGSFGPQGITLGGFQTEYRGADWFLRGDYSHSSYRPNRNSTYTSEGDLFRLGAGVDLFDRQLKLAVDYRYADPNYDPMILSYPGTSAGLNPFRVYHRLPDHDQFWHLYSLHDTDQFPHNRKGIVASLQWNYNDSDSIKLRYRDQTQVRTSLQDVRYQANSISPGTPAVAVLGFSPGFFDVIFREYSPLSFDANLQPREDQRGRLAAFGFDWRHKIEDSAFDLELSYDQYHFHRSSGLSASQGGSQNRVDLLSSIGHFRLGYQADSQWKMGLGYDFGLMRGHYDPFGVYNPYAISMNNIEFRNRDTWQHQPFVDANWKVNDQMTVDLDFRLIDTVDRVPTQVSPGTPGSPFSLAHPFQYQGYQFRTKLEFSF